MSEILRKAYASAPDGQVIIRTLEILPPTSEPIRVCTGYEDQELALETGETVTFTAGPLQIADPKKDTSGQQNLRFAIANVTGVAQAAVDEALESGEEVPVIYRVYLDTDLSAPAALPYEMTLVGGGFDGIMLNVEASYYDLLNTQWPRDRYTAEFAPGLRYI